MKKTISIFMLLFTLVVVANAQTKTATTAVPAPAPAKDMVKKEAKPQNAAAYSCPKCFHITKGEGQCTECKVAKVQLGSYYCPKCNMNGGAKPGNCTMCKTANVQMTRKYCSAKAGTPAKEMHPKKAA